MYFEIPHIVLTVALHRDERNGELYTTLHQLWWFKQKCHTWRVVWESVAGRNAELQTTKWQKRPHKYYIPNPN